MARPQEETSNALFEELGQWEQYLKAENLDIHVLARLDENKQGAPDPRETGELKQKIQHRRAAPRLRGPA